jgi:hypothetical protein
MSEESYKFVYDSSKHLINYRERYQVSLSTRTVQPPHRSLPIFTFAPPNPYLK